MFETEADSERMTNAKVGFVLAAVICIAILSIWNLFLMLAQPGRVPRPSLALVAVPILYVAGMWHFRAVPLRLALAMGWTQAAVRVALWFGGAPRGLQRAGALSREMLTELAAVIVIVVIVKWLGSARQGPPSDREKPAS